MSDKVRRWDFDDWGEYEIDDGPYVHYDDYASLESKLKALIEAVKKHLEVKQFSNGETTTGWVCYDPSLSEALAFAQAEEAT
jgi:hypothetical protein